MHSNHDALLTDAATASPQTSPSGSRKTLLTGADGRLSLILCEPSADGISTAWAAMTTAGPRDLIFADGTVVHDGKMDPHEQTVVRAAAALMDPVSRRRPFDRPLAEWMMAAYEAAGPSDPDFARFLAACGSATLQVLARGWETTNLALLDHLTGWSEADAFFAEWPFLLGLLRIDRFEEAGPVPAEWTVAECIRDAFDEEFDEFDHEHERSVALDRRRNPKLDMAPLAEVVRAGTDAVAVGTALAAFAGSATSTAALTLLLKRMRGKACDMAAGAGGELVAAMELVSCVPADWIPDSEAEFTALTGTAAHLRILVEASSGALSYATLASSSKGRWREFLARLVAVCRDISRVGEAADMVAAFRRQVVAPGLLHALAYERPGACVDVSLRTMLGSAYADRIAGEAADGRPDRVGAALDRLCWDLLFSAKSAPSVLEASRRWHAAVGVMNDNIGTLFRLDWDVPFDRMELSGGGELVAIANSLALSREGAELRHCVGGGGYVERARRRESVIASIRRPRPDGTLGSTSTVEMTGWTPGEWWRPQVVQHRGVCNARPPHQDRSDLHRAMVELTGRVATAVPSASDAAEYRPWRALVPDLLRDARMRAACDPALARNHPRGTDPVGAPPPGRGPGAERPQRGIFADEVTVGAQYDWLSRPAVAVALAQWRRFLPVEAAAGPQGLLAASERHAAHLVDALRLLVRDATADYRPASALDLARMLPSVTAERFHRSRARRILRRVFAPVTPMRAAAAILSPFAVYAVVLLAAPLWSRDEPPIKSVRAQVPVVATPRPAPASIGGLEDLTADPQAQPGLRTADAPAPTPPERRVVSLDPLGSPPAQVWEVIGERYGLPAGKARAVFADGHAGEIDLLRQTVSDDGTASSAWSHSWAALAVVGFLALATVAAEAVHLATRGLRAALFRQRWRYGLPEWPRNIAFAGAVLASMYFMSAPREGLSPIALLMALGACGFAFRTRTFLCLLLVATWTLIDALSFGIVAPFPSVARFYGPLGAGGWDIAGLFGIAAAAVLMLAPFGRGGAMPPEAFPLEEPDLLVDEDVQPAEDEVADAEPARPMRV